MGLDHWLYKIRKSDPDFVKSLDGKTYDEAQALADENDAMLVTVCDETSDLKQVADMVTLVCFETDEETLLKDHGIPTEATYCGGLYEPGHVKVHYRIPADGDKPEQTFTLELTDGELDKYDVPYDQRYWVCDYVEVVQWRKRYDISDVICSAFPVENCGFHRIDGNAKILNQIESLDKDLTLPRLREGEALFYHEWY